MFIALFNLMMVVVFRAQAQVPLLPEIHKPVPHLSEHHLHTRGQTQTQQKVRSDINAKELALHLKAQFENVMNSWEAGKPQCHDEKAVDYILALQIRGDLNQCTDYAKTCAQDGNLQSPKVILIGALCESSRFQFQKAQEIFEMATDKKWSKSQDYEEAVYQYASFAMYGIYENKVDEILSRPSSWTSAEKALWKSLLLRVGHNEPQGHTKKQVEDFLKSKILSSRGDFQALLKSIKIRLAAMDYDYAEALDGLKKEGPSLGNPMLWYDLLYDNLYHGLDTEFAKARLAYDVYDQYSNPWMRFPTESNTYNYTQIYSSVCKDQLLQGKEKRIFDLFKSNIRGGKITATDALKQAESFVSQHPEKADVLTTYGGLLSLLGQHEKAFETYWKAHRFCRYYNRANWGLTLEKRYFKYSQMPDYKSNEDKVELEMADQVIPSEMSVYISNWNSLTSDVQKRVAHSGRIWLPYVKNLNGEGFKAYIKYAFDLLSESPELASMKDTRIGGVNYPHDNRLWDDVRGVGGNNVVADLSEVFQTVQGDYNLFAHEVAHQVHRLMDSESSLSSECITKLYSQAYKQNNFPDGYSAYNKQEHFAQAVNYYLIPDDAPKRFGLNRSWLENYNVKQLKFIQSLDQAQGDWMKVVCSL